MQRSRRLSAPGGRVLILACLIGASSACVFAPLEKTTAPMPDAQSGDAREPAGPPPERASHQSTPVPPSAPRPVPPRERRPRDRVVVLLPKDRAGFEQTLPALESQLAARGFDVVAMESHAAPAALQAQEAGQKTYAIAVGSEAEKVAARLQVPTVLCHVAPSDPALEESEVHGVAALPPLALQLRAWKQLSPSLARVALILGPGREATAAEARRAAQALSVRLIYRTVSSDQEALYLFKRLAADVDGLWLLPDNRVLSPRVIKAMLDHASRHRVQTLVFTPTLLHWGALVSVSATPRNLAWTLAEVVNRLAATPEHVPAVTPLSEVEIKVNEDLAGEFGIKGRASSWTLHSEAW